ncbi:hypothetical protein M405DRAFT_804906 [Rhizopogon salebrosus TDB-379]|nr:hypothetical protein M405DRAFT_804906 [Rhizopogon salebrosus TDB-379]
MQYSWRSWSNGVQPLSKRESTQFLRHASRVRSLSINGYRDGAPLIAHYHLHLLSVLPIETRMFPRLLSLSWMVRPPDSRLLSLFLSPTLRHCYLLNVHCDLKPIARRCDVLESLAVAPANAPMTTRDISMLSDTVRSCRRLVKLRCPPLNSAAWKYLSNLPTLVTLTVNGPGADDLLGQDNFSPFLNLKILSVYLGTLHFATAKNITTFIRHSEFPSLKEFHLQAINDLPWRQVERLLHALSQCNACQTLECAEICFSDPEALEHVANPLLVVKQLLSFTQLRRLSLDIGGSIFLDNDLLLEAMSSWPHIESLELDDQHRYQPTVTFRGLLTALQKCLHLHTLRVFMDAVDIDIDPKAESFQHPSLRTLHLGVSPVRDAEAVTVIISSMLPHVGEVVYHENIGENSRVWSEVNKRLQSFADC